MKPLIDPDKLEQLARAATPGRRDWRYVGNIPGDGSYRLDVVDANGDQIPGQRAILITDCSSKATGYMPLPNEADAAFIAAADCAAVLELVQRLRAAEGALHAIADEVPARGDHGGDCAYCGGIAAMDDVDKHQVDCPWRIARRAVEAQR